MGVPSGDLSLSFIPLQHQGQPRNVTIYQLLCAINKRSAPELYNDIDAVRNALHAEITAVDNKLRNLGTSGSTSTEATLARLLSLEAAATAISGRVDSLETAAVSDSVALAQVAADIAAHRLRLLELENQMPGAVNAAGLASALKPLVDDLRARVCEGNVNEARGVVKLDGNGRQDLRTSSFIDDWCDAAKGVGGYDAQARAFYLGDILLSDAEARNIYRKTHQFPHYYALRRRVTINTPMRPGIKAVLPVFDECGPRELGRMPLLNNSGAVFVQFIYPGPIASAPTTSAYANRSYLTLDHSVVEPDLIAIVDKMVLTPDNAAPVASTTACPKLRNIFICGLDHDISLLAPSISPASLRCLCVHRDTRGENAGNPITVKLPASVTAKIPGAGEITGDEWEKVRDAAIANNIIFVAQ